MSLSIRNKKRFAAIAFACMLAVPAFAHAYDLDAHLGYYFDSEAIALGFGLLSGLGDQPRWFFNPNAQAIMGDKRDMVALNGDFHYDFAASDDLTFWAGGGPGVYVIDMPGDENEVDIGLNLLAGFGAQSGSVRPFLQGKAILMDDSEASLAVGIRF